MQHKERLDVLLVSRGLSESREKAKATIMAGLVFVDNQRVDKAGTKLPVDVEITVKGNPIPRSDSNEVRRTTQQKGRLQVKLQIDSEQI